MDSLFQSLIKGCIGDFTFNVHPKIVSIFVWRNIYIDLYRQLQKQHNKKTSQINPCLVNYRSLIDKKKTEKVGEDKADSLADWISIYEALPQQKSSIYKLPKQLPLGPFIKISTEI